MSTDRVEIYTQPAEQDQKSDSVEESIATKLEELIEKHPILAEDDGNEEGQQEEEEKDERKTKAHEKQDRAKEDIKKSHYTTHPEGRRKETPGSDSETESEGDEGDAGDVELDEDGMEVPQGKIPLDGQFSTEELKKLVEIAQEKGILSEDVDLKVIDSGEIGDRIRLADAQKREEKEKEEKEKEEKEKGENNKTTDEDKNTEKDKEKEKKENKDD
ncbi:hypothetical protein I9W82_000937 [Candida metapsilosis]|uniref:Uncharacterized protein n=1 Tax=Candida metapsilosis TaxID=273372 RepID=A0A8H7ZK61_9ASCO|nr:hypothetical protein I9W82_000937 [Candida metapsilosis]